MTENIDPILVEKIIGLLRDFPSNGKPDMSTDAALAAHLAGFIERCEVKKPCRECGTERFDYSYMRITAAGQIALMLAEDRA